VRPRGSYKARRFGGTLLRSLLQLLVTANVVASSQNLYTLKIETILSSETSVLTRDTRRHIPEDGILRSCLYAICFSVRPNHPADATGWTQPCSVLGDKCTILAVTVQQNVMSGHRVTEKNRVNLKRFRPAIVGKSR
jgi:hypothetical protein